MPSEPPASPRRFTVSPSDAGRRLDQYLASRLPELSRTRIQELIDEGRAHISGRAPRRSHRLAAGEIVDIEVLPRPTVPEPQPSGDHCKRSAQRAEGERRQAPAGPASEATQAR